MSKYISVALRRHLPMVRVDYIRVEGKEWVPDPEKRYQTIEKLGPLVLEIPSLVSLVMEDIPKTFSLTDDGIHRKDLPLIPRNVIREAIVNALMHRNYRKHSPVQIIRYANRIEIRNAGYSLKPEEQLGEPGSVPRNPRIAAVLHDLGLAETKGTGIRAMQEAMKQANLTLPLFESDRVADTFTVRLLAHHLLSEEDWKWLEQFKDYNLSNEEARALIIAREVGAIDNSAYRSITRVDALTASAHLRRLRDLGLLEQKGQARATYYIPTPKLLTDWGIETNVEKFTRMDPTTYRQVGGLNPTTYAQKVGLGPLPKELAEEILSLKRRNPPQKLRNLIYKLCSWRPLSPIHLEGLLGKGRAYLVERHLRPMLRNGELEYIYPDNPAHPRQAYRAVPGRRDLNESYVEQREGDNKG